MNHFTLIFITLLSAVTAFKLWLAYLQRSCVAAHRERVPAPFNHTLSLEAHHRAADYTRAKTFFEQVNLLVNALLLLCWTVGGGLNLLDETWRTSGLSPVPAGIGVLVSFFLIANILELPLSIYHTFVIEQRFGFNRMTPALFVTDLMKEGLLALGIGIPLAWLVLELMQHAGTLWWLAAWLLWMLFLLFMLWAYPAFIAPLFNKFTPLQDTELKGRIEALLARCGFTSNGIFIMDGSRRSGHGNAYFTGLGRNKRIVFYDTLMEMLTHEEIEAVLAHELGHYRRRHVHKRLISMALLGLAGLAILGWLATQAWFYQGLGVHRPSDHGALILFMLAMPVFSYFLGPLMLSITRRHEFEADDFATEQAAASDLIQALVKLYDKNAATLTPDPLYSAFHDSHPPAPVRIAHLSAKIGDHQR